MALTPRLELRQSQTLVMTPQLQKAIKLLQYSNLEVREFVEEEVADNPLLELKDEDTSTESGMAEEHGATASPDNIEPEYRIEELTKFKNVKVMIAGGSKCIEQELDLVEIVDRVIAV